MLQQQSLPRPRLMPQEIIASSVFSHPAQPGCWTTLISAQNTFLFYNVTGGGGATAQIDAAGNYVPLQTFPDLSAGWAQIAGTQRHVLFYNPSANFAVTGEFLEEGMYRDLFGYADFSTGWTHVSALKVETLVHPEQPVLDPVIDVIRPDDLLNLSIECRNLQLDKSDRANPVLVPTDAVQPAYLIVHFPPQTIAEEAVYEPRKEPGNNLEDDGQRQTTETREERERREAGDGLTQSIGSLLTQRPAWARIAQPSRLVFQLPANSNPRIPYTIEALLNWTRLDLHVAPVAAMAEHPTPEQLAAAPAIAPPSELETAIEMPYRLILSPNRDAVWTHATAPKTHAGRTELWHTRLAHRADEKIVDLSKAHPAPLRAIWSPDYVAENFKFGNWPTLGEADTWAGDDVLTAMNSYDRHELVILTSAFRGFVEDKPVQPGLSPAAYLCRAGDAFSAGRLAEVTGQLGAALRVVAGVCGARDPLSAPLESGSDPGGRSGAAARSWDARPDHRASAFRR